MKYIVSLLFALTMQALLFAQNAETKPYYSFNHKAASNQSLNWEEYTKARKELKPVSSGVEVKSFTLSISAKDVFVDYECTGNQFSKKATDMIEKLRSEKKLGTKLLIEKVVVSENGEEKKVPDMVISIY